MMDQPVANPELETSYRSVSKAAVLSLFLTLLSLSVLIAKVMVIVPLIGAIFAFVGLRNIRRYPDELVGRRMAGLGLIGCLVLLVGGAAYHTYDYVTEVPPGYQRISFRALKELNNPDLPYSQEALALDGKKVFLKGFVRPGARRKNLKDFILVGDFGSCCFGGNPKITDVVAVSIQGEERVNYGLRLRKIAGVFHLNRHAASTSEKDVPRVFYQIDAEVVR